MNKYNEVAFTPDEVDKNMHMDLLRYLTEANEKYETSFNEIHVTSDGYCTIIQWVDRDYKEGNGCARFEFVDEEQVIMTDYRLPNGVHVYCETEYEYKDLLNEFLKENPNYEKNEFGNWIDKDEEKALEEELGLG